MPAPSQTIASILAHQDGVISKTQATAGGMTVTQIRTRLERGDWAQILPRIYLSAEHLPSTAGRVRAAVLWAGPGACLAGAAAAWWWELTDTEPSAVEIIVPRSNHPRSRPGITVLRRDLARQDRARHRHTAVTGLAMSALFGAVALGNAGPAMLDRALQRKVQIRDLDRVLDRNAGCTGSAAARRLLVAAADGAAAISERLLIRLLRDSDVTGWKVNALVVIGGTTIRPDFAFSREGIAIEVDGWAWHHSPDRFQRDRVRQNALVGAGWIVLRFTWFDLTTDPRRVVREIKAALRQRRILALS